MDEPVRIQRKRTPGWKMPANTVSVTRPGRFGNPFKAEDALEAGYRDGPGMAAWAFRQWLLGDRDFEGQHVGRRTFLRLHLPELRGKNLACWCRPDQACHADVLLKIANAPQSQASVGSPDQSPNSTPRKT